jgi:hypothetical protein
LSAVLHGLIQRAFIQATSLHDNYRSDTTGAIWRYSPLGWIKIGQLMNLQDAEDFLLSKLSQEDR